MAKLAGNKAVVTGGARGIGRAIALLFAREGADIAIFDRDAKGAEAAAAEIRSLGRSALVVLVDVGAENEVADGFRKVARELGEADILVNCAGLDTNSRVVDMPTEMWDEMIRVHLRGTFLCTRAALAGMLRRRRGRIVNISSQLAHKGAAEMAHYAAAKAAIIGFTRSLAYEVAEHNVTVNAIAPGPVDTELWRKIPEHWRKQKLAEIPLHRPATVEEIAPTALLLASADGGYYLGATLNPNGGDVMV
ncbi:MAG: SDR family NAD(P)-dependent oxidoreductase [Acetobacteraceae bacterium]